MEISGVAGEQPRQAWHTAFGRLLDGCYLAANQAEEAAPALADPADATEAP